MITAKALTLPKSLRDFILAVTCFAVGAAPAYAAQSRVASIGLKSGHRVMTVKPLVSEEDPNSVFVNVESDVYNASGIATERVTCLTMMTGVTTDPYTNKLKGPQTGAVIDSSKLAFVGAAINVSRGRQTNYSATYMNGVRDSCILVRDEGARSSTINYHDPHSNRLPDKIYALPDERGEDFQKQEGEISKAMYGMCVALIAEAKDLEAQPNTGRKSDSVDSFLEKRTYDLPLRDDTQTAHGVFLQSGANHGAFLKELGLK